MSIAARKFRREALGGHLVAGDDTPELLEVADEPFDAVALLVESSVERPPALLAAPPQVDRPAHGSAKWGACRPLGHRRKLP